MNDVPRAEACASKASAIEGPSVSTTPDTVEGLTTPLTSVLPRLAEIGARLAVIAPTLPLFFGTDSLGNGVRGC
ncbi:MAG: hypothetical protein OHK0015_35910 [Chloroflexi bacterium OHK40]